MYRDPTFTYVTPQAWSAFVRLAQARAGQAVEWGLTLGQVTQLTNAGLLHVYVDGNRRRINLSFTSFGEGVADCHVVERNL